MSTPDTASADAEPTTSVTEAEPDYFKLLVTRNEPAADGIYFICSNCVTSRV